LLGSFICHPYFLMSHSDRLALLRKWRSKYGLRATYGKLAECFYNAERLEMVEAICKVLQANTSMPRPAAMQPYVAYSTTQNQPPQQQFMQSPQQQLMQPNPSLTGGKTCSILYCVYATPLNIHHTAVTASKYLFNPCSWVCPTSVTIPVPSPQQPVSSWCHIPVSISSTITHWLHSTTKPICIPARLFFTT